MNLSQTADPSAIRASRLSLSAALRSFFTADNGLPVLEVSVPPHGGTIFEKSHPGWWWALAAIFLALICWARLG